MIAGTARRVMILALRCLPRDGGEWGPAMLAEFNMAYRDGKPLGFAIGCLIAAWRRMPFHPEGQIALVTHAFVLGSILPIAIYHFGCAVSGARFMLSGSDHYHTMLMASGFHGHVLANVYVSAIPTLTFLLLLLGSAHLAVAWFVLDGAWRRAAMLWLTATIIAALIVEIINTVVSNGDGTAIQFAASAIELAAIPLLAMWQNARARSSHLKEA